MSNKMSNFYIFIGDKEFLTSLSKTLKSSSDIDFKALRPSKAVEVLISKALPASETRDLPSIRDKPRLKRLLILRLNIKPHYQIVRYNTNRIIKAIRKPVDRKSLVHKN
ncbi:hypothetical protein SAMN04488491_2277 [Psychrobacter sp. LV10R520-6]|nr:hypothetical protein SAMN04488491_2277 [Psychrobacter sp. LV10R520-6]